MSRLWWVVAAVLVLVGCEDLIVDPQVTGQEYLFDVSYQSTGFVFEWTGIVVTEDGSIVAYDRQEDWTPGNTENLTPDDLEDRYRLNRRVVGQVPMGELLDRVADLHDVQDRYSSPNVACMDAGTVIYGGYLYDPDADRYTPVVVREEGERPRQNSSPAGIGLADWLMDLARTSDVDPLSIFQDTFCAP